MTIASGSKWHCKHCFKSFGRKGDLTRHERLHSGIKDHLCTTCGKRFAQFTALKTHQNTHTRAKPYKCGLFACKASFGDPSSCARHRKETHGGVPSYKCPVSGCSSSIKRRAAFKNHLKKHGLDPSTILSESVERCINQPSALPNQFIPMKEEEQMTLYTLDEHYEVKPALTMPMTYCGL
ncbi:hypothetical protein BV25DRAFT_1817432 [Artomyces pyxidatus]|uniref:Uncharacterized protein n=1 Tax=Artomyces pyxidatus TaxID=48021 RepID=A0ACB8TJD5_9AGAM|nr:hypothetical protein BV25DRAFT_1817432 [Artomyces pyxidatus]